MKTLNKSFFILVILNLLVFNVQSQVITTQSAAISASIVEPLLIEKTVSADLNNAAIMLIILPVANGTHTAVTYYFTGTTGYNYSNLSSNYPLIFKSGINTLKVANFISDPVLAAGSNLIAGVYVAVSPSNVTVNYN
jgi:hypothetical protein